MANHVSKSEDPCQQGLEQQAERPAPRPFLRMRPQGFFSDKFELEIVEDYSKADVEQERESSPKWLVRLIELNLLLLIVLVGVPVLIYCILSSAS